MYGHTPSKFFHSIHLTFLTLCLIFSGSVYAAPPQLTLTERLPLVVGFDHRYGYQGGVANISVSDSDSTNFEGGTLRISLNTHADSDNEFVTHSVNHRFSRQAGSEVLGGFDGVIGTLVNDISVPGNDLVIALNANATPSSITELFFTDVAWGIVDPNASSVGTRTFTVTLTEANGEQGSASITIPAITTPQTSKLVSTFSDNVVLPATANSEATAEPLLSFEIDTTHEGFPFIGATISEMTFTLSGNFDTSNLDFRLDGPLLYFRDPDQRFILSGNRLSMNETGYRLTSERTAFTLRAWYKDTSKITDNATLQVSLDESDVASDDAIPFNGFSPAPAITSGTISSVVEASELRFAQIPDSTTTGLTLSPAITVNATDSLGNVDVDYVSDVTLGIASSSSGTLSGDTTVTPTNGISVFNNLSISSSVTSGSENTSLQASASGLNSATSSPVQVFAQNRAPVISGTPATQVNESVLYSFQPSASDPDSPTISFTVANLPSWAVFNGTSGQISGTPGFRDAGVYENIVITVTDGDLSASLAPFNITVNDVNTVPVIINAPGQVADVLEDVSVQVLLNANDAESDELTWSVLTQPTHGSAQIVSSGTQFNQVLYTPNANYAGTDSVLLSVSDGRLSASFTLNFNVQTVNDAPAISGSPATTINENEFYSFAPVASDIEGDSLTFSALNLPGWLAIDAATGILSGTPGFDAAGTYSGIQLTVSDGELSATLAPFAIQVSNVNRAPVIDVGDTFTINLSEDSGVSVIMKASDPDGDELVWSRVTQNINGSVELTVDGSFSYQPGTGFNGKDTIIFELSDGNLSDSIAITFNVRAVNDAPEISGAPRTEINEQSSYQFFPLASDEDGDELTFSVHNLPTWLTFNTVTGEISGAADSDDIGLHDNIIVSVSDGELQASLAPFSIRVVEGNEPPQLEDLSFIIAEDNSLSHQLPVTDSNGDSLSYSIEQSPQNGSVHLVAQVFIYEPDSNFSGSDSFIIQASDNIGVPQNVNVTVMVNSLNDAPELQALTLNTIEDSSVVGDIAASDADGDVLTLSISNQGQLGTATLTGNRLEYTPKSDVNGTDSITIMASDGEVDSLLVVVVNIASVNDLPVAKGESLSMIRHSGGQYLINVLRNDSDKDIITNNDQLRITNLSSSFGNASVYDDQVLLNVGADFLGEVTVDYLISDLEGATASATTLLNIVASLTESSISIRPPRDIVVNAKGLLTAVDLGEAIAMDPNGNPMSVKLVRDDTLFAPGRHLVTWQVETNTDETIVGIQQVDVNPLISLGGSYSVEEGQTAEIDVVLNGESPTYPVVVDYVVTGTADTDDHNLQSGQFSIEQGTSATITFDTFADSLEDDNESVIIELTDSVNSSKEDRSVVSIVETQLAPSLYLHIVQNDQTKTTLAQTDGDFDVTPVFSHSILADDLLYQWRLNGNLLTGNQGELLSLNARQLPTGLNTVSLEVTQDNDIQLSTVVDINFLVVSRHQTLTQNDQDGDLIPDSNEGFVDSDIDGIADYLDAISLCNQVQFTVEEQRKYLLQSSSSTCVKLGSNALEYGADGIGISKAQLAKSAKDDEYEFFGEAVDVEIYQLNSAGEAVELVVPLDSPITSDAWYRIYKDTGWQDFIIDESNQIYSAPGAEGVCPPIGDEQWMTGVISDSWCIKLELSDGGANDADGAINNHIKIFGGLATPAMVNRPPVAVNDTEYATAGIQKIIDVLGNDYDPDGDDIKLRWMSAGLGEIEFLEDGTVLYTPFFGIQGQDEILYEIEDANGEKATAIIEVMISDN